MCRCCQECLESCYWHLIEERFCFDTSIALYEEPIKKSEKNNNMFENMAFYDSVSVIAGRAIVTIDPIPVKNLETKPIVTQPTKSLKWQSDNPRTFSRSLSKSVPVICEEKSSENESSEDDHAKGESTPPIEVKDQKSLSTSDVTKKLTLDPSTLEDYERTRKKSLRERRMSKSLYLKIDTAKDMPIIRQQSMPKFYLDTPEENQSESTLCRAPSAVLTSPVINNPSGFQYDLYSVVQLEKSKSFHTTSNPVPIHKDSSNKRLLQIKERMKLKKSKSSVNTASLAGNSSNFNSSA